MRRQRRKAFRRSRLASVRFPKRKQEPTPHVELFESPFAAWSWETYARRARWSMRSMTKRRAARWKTEKWEEHFMLYAEAGHRRICADCGAATNPRDPVFDLCRQCEQQWRMAR